jgi:hopanoid biosynthesis associated RND transporter like protein HpnN
MRQRSLTALANTVCRRPLAILLVGIAVAVVSGVYTACRLEFKTSRNDLIGRDSEYWRLYSAYAKEFHSEEDYVILVEGDKPDRNKATIDALVHGLLSPQNNPRPGDDPGAQQFVADDLFYQVNLEAFQRWFLYYLSMEDLNCLKDFPQLVFVLQHQPNMSGFLHIANESLMQLGMLGADRKKCTLGFLPMMTTVVGQVGDLAVGSSPAEWHSPWMQAFIGPGDSDKAEEQMKWQGYQTFRHGKMFLLMIHPRVEKGTPEALHEATVPKLRRIMAEAQSQFPETKIGLTGEPVLDYDETIQSQRDATKATILTLILICILFAVGFQEILRPLMAVLTMVIVLAGCMGYATLSVGHLNMITVTFAVMILGLGIDLGIQFIARYEEELKKGLERAEAVRLTIHHTGPSIITAGVTNAAAFFAMGLSGFRGVNELGTIAGGGMLIATVATMTVLPALLLLVHRKQETTQIPAQSMAARVENALLRRPALTLGACALVTLFALFIGGRVRFDYNVLNLQSVKAESVKTELTLLHADAESTIFASVVCSNLDETRQLQKRLAELPAVGSVHSIAEMIPEDQGSKIKTIHDIRQALGAIHFDVVPDDVDEILKALGSLRLRANALAREAGEHGDNASLEVLIPLTNAVTQAQVKWKMADRTQLQSRLADYEHHFYADLESQLAIITNQADRAMTVEDVPGPVRRMFIGKTGKFLVEVFPKEDIWEREPLVRFVHEVQQVAPGVTGTPSGLYEFVDILLRGYIKAALWAFLVITVLIVLDFRNGYAALLTLLPLVVGMIWMVGVMVVGGINFNPANIMVLPLIVGIGVAYGIYVVQRYRESQEATFYSKSTGRAVVLSALTTTFAFASLLIGGHRGIRSLGLVMTIGVIACLIAALALLPALLETARRKGWKV